MKVTLLTRKKTGKLLERLGPAYVFCAGVSKTEFQAVFSGVRYVPNSVVEKMCQSIELPVKMFKMVHTSHKCHQR